jgi:DnaK suppressor protein
MEILSEAQLAELEVDLRVLSRTLGEMIESVREGSKPVGLDEPIGRLSRMDAIQQQNMVQANRQAAQRRLAATQSALHRLEQGEYGECVSCGEEVGFPRLKAQPETPFCVGCQGKRETSR